MDVTKVLDYFRETIEQNARIDERMKSLEVRVGELLPAAKQMLVHALETHAAQQSLTGQAQGLNRIVEEVRASLAETRERLARAEVVIGLQGLQRAATESSPVARIAGPESDGPAS